MKIKKLIATLSLTALIVISACSLEEDKPYCFARTGGPATAVNGPVTTTVNTAITFDVGIKIYNNCAFFNGFSESTNFPKDITAIIDYDGCECTPGETTITKQYTFTASTAGTYELRFQTADSSSPIVKTVTVTN